MSAGGVEVRTIPFGRPIIGEEEQLAVRSVLEGHMLTHGPRVREFEAAFAEFTGAPHAIALASCTAGLHLAYFYLGLGEGDEVIVPAQTHVATAHAVELCGAKPVFVDAEARTGNLDLDRLESAITDRTRAVSLVHYLGMPVDMPRLTVIAAASGAFVVEDCALAMGSYLDGTHMGLFGDVGVFSFYPVKHMTTAEGGMLITKHADVAAKISQQRAFGIDRNIVAERKVPGMYDVQALGFNYRMNEIGAALGLEQLKRMPGFLETRRANYDALSAGLREIDEVELLQSTHDGFQSSYYCHSMLLRAPLHEKRVAIMARMGEKGVGTSIYYPQPVPHMSYYRDKYGYTEGSFPVAADISNRSVALPVGPHVRVDDIDYMMDVIKDSIVKAQ